MKTTSTNATKTTITREAFITAAKAIGLLATLVPDQNGTIELTVLNQPLHVAPICTISLRGEWPDRLVPVFSKNARFLRECTTPVTHQGVPKGVQREYEQAICGPAGIYKLCAEQVWDAAKVTKLLPRIANVLRRAEKAARVVETYLHPTDEDLSFGEDIRTSLERHGLRLYDERRGTDLGVCKTYAIYPRTPGVTRLPHDARFWIEVTKFTDPLRFRFILKGWRPKDGSKRLVERYNTLDEMVENLREVEHAGAVGPSLRMRLPAMALLLKAINRTNTPKTPMVNT